jgi:glutaredoxin
MFTIDFYTRPQCPLCEEAKQVLIMLQDDYDFNIQEHDIESNDMWTEEYGLIIPVINVGENTLQYGQIDFYELSKRLQEIS